MNERLTLTTKELKRLKVLEWIEGIFDPPCPPALEGRSLARVPSGLDSGTSGEWYVQLAPDPGAPGSAPPATATPTPTVPPPLSPTPSSARPSAVVIDEIMQNPAAVGDAAGEWVETQYTTRCCLDDAFGAAVSEFGETERGPLGCEQPGRG